MPEEEERARVKKVDITSITLDCNKPTCLSEI
jgi:hypothetical protein